jgi:LmbE family N-acetylglucosaminyl deacetylase
MNILAIGAHADDIELGCGGYLISQKRNDANTTILLTTDSEYTDINGQKRTAELATQEAAHAADILGAKLITLNNKCQNQTWNKELIGSIEAVIKEINPDIILTHYIHDTHQDHYATSISTISAARRSHTIWMYEPFTPSGRGPTPFKPQIYADISDSHDQKLKSIMCHWSQCNKYGKTWLDAIEARSILRGFESGVKYAEAFEVVRMLVK